MNTRRNEWSILGKNELNTVSTWIEYYILGDIIDKVIESYFICHKTDV